MKIHIASCAEVQPAAKFIASLIAGTWYINVGPKKEVFFFSWSSCMSKIYAATRLPRFRFCKQLKKKEKFTRTLIRDRKLSFLALHNHGLANGSVLKVTGQSCHQPEIINRRSYACHGAVQGVAKNLITLVRMSQSKATQ